MNYTYPKEYFNVPIYAADVVPETAVDKRFSDE